MASIPIVRILHDNDEFEATTNEYDVRHLIRQCVDFCHVTTIKDFSNSEVIFCPERLACNYSEYQRNATNFHVFTGNICDHVLKLAENPCNHISWSPDATMIFTDGSCKGNGKSNGEAGFSVAVFCAPNFKTPHEVKTEMVVDRMYALNNGEFAPDLGTDRVVPTNNRGELLGIIRGLETIRNMDLPTSSAFELVTDCFIYKNIIMNSYKKKSKKEKEKLKNPDMVHYAVELYDELNEVYDIAITHQHGHSLEPKDKEGRPWILWNGNNVVDIAAQKIVHG